MFLFSDKCSCPPHTNSFSTISVQDLEILHTFGPHSCPWISIGIVIHMVPFFVTVDIVCMSFTYYVLILIFRIVPITVSVALNATYIFTISVLRILPACIEMLGHFSQKCVSACIFFVCFRILKLKSTIRKRSKSMISAKLKPIQIFIRRRMVIYWSAVIEISRRRWRKTIWQCVLVFIVLFYMSAIFSEVLNFAVMLCATVYSIIIMDINLFYNNYDKINEVLRNISIKLL